MLALLKEWAAAIWQNPRRGAVVVGMALTSIAVLVALAIWAGADVATFLDRLMGVQ